MAHTEHEHGASERPERPHKHTALWLIVTVLIVTIAVPMLVLLLTLPESP